MAPTPAKQDTLEGLGKGSRVWFRQGPKNWQLATLQSHGKKCVIRPDTELGEGTGNVLEVSADLLAPANPSLLDGVPDVTSLSFLNEPSILHALRLRYGTDSVYTHAGPVLVAVNPFKPVPLYTNEHVRRYMDATASTAANPLEPHVYLTADTAYKQMGGAGRSQSILITGESGAGKTETTKIAMKYLAGLAGGTGMEDRVLETNPILEAFGNAKTIHNNNSSRFGKLIEIHFNSRRAICGAHIQTYLLEKSRVVHQLPGERSYHIFYQLCRGATDEERAECHLPSADCAIESFAYLAGSGCSAIAGVNDAQDLNEVKHAMSIVGIDADEQRGIWRSLSAVLWLGNIDFAHVGDDAVQLAGGEDSREALAAAAALLSCSEPALESALTQRRMIVGSERITRNLNMDAAIENRDALAKAVYEALFRWLINRINAGLTGSNQGRTTELCILDIYGFECFKENSFEQLCINYANERLQQQFAAHMLKLEQEIYESEGVDWARVKFEDNQDCVDLIESRPPAGVGILSLLDEECMFPKGTDSSFSAKLRQQHASHARFSFNPRVPGDEFTVHHYAGPVNYSAGKFLDKNKDALSPDLVELLRNSSSSMVTALAQELVKGQERKGSQTVASRFREQLRDLIARLDKTSLHFIRCIKPNSSQEPSSFDQNLVLHQLRCCGVLEVARIARAGYPTRYPHVEFAERYRMLLPGLPIGPLPAGITPLNVCARVLEHFNIPKTAFQVGKTKLFFRAGVLGKLEDKKDRILRSVLKLQSTWRMTVCRREFLRCRWAAIVLQAGRRGMLARREYSEMLQKHRAALSVQTAYRQHVARQRYLEIQNACLAIQMAWRRHLLAGRVSVRVQERMASDEAQKAEAKRLEAERKAEQERIEAQRRAEQERLAAEAAAAAEAQRQLQQENDAYANIQKEFGLNGDGIREVLRLWNQKALEPVVDPGVEEKLAESKAELAAAVAYAADLEREIEELREENAVLMQQRAEHLQQEARRTKHDDVSRLSMQSDDSISIMSYSDGGTPGKGAPTPTSDTPRMVIGRAGVAGAVAALNYEFDKKSELFTDDAIFVKEVVDGVSTAPGMDVELEMHRLLQRYRAWKADFKGRLRATQHAVRKTATNSGVKMTSSVGTPKSAAPVVGKTSSKTAPKSPEVSQTHSQDSSSLTAKLKSFASLKSKAR